MIGKLLVEGNEKLKEKGIGGKRGAGTGAVTRMTRDYIDSLMIEARVIDSTAASTEMRLFGETFSTPIMVAALSGLGGICANPMVEVAKGALAAGTAMWVGIGEEPELKAIIETGAKTIKIIKPYKDKNLISTKSPKPKRTAPSPWGWTSSFPSGGRSRTVWSARS